jgi:hypothetical protein
LERGPSVRYVNIVLATYVIRMIGAL